MRKIIDPLANLLTKTSVFIILPIVFCDLVSIKNIVIIIIIIKRQLAVIKVNIIQIISFYFSLLLVIMHITALLSIQQEHYFVPMSAY